MKEDIKIMLVDDEKETVNILVGFFEHEGFEPIVARSGAEAVEKFKENRPDIIYLDIRMKGMNGLEVLKAIKEIDKNVKIIMITGYSEEEYKEQARDYGCDAFIEKPLTFDAMKKALDMKLVEVKDDLNIMVVDDKSEHRDFVIKYLQERINAKYTEASGGVEALKMVKDQPCNLMLLDLDMPVVNGFAVIEQAHAMNPHIDIIIVTAYCDNEIFERVMCNGVIDYVEKPVKLEELEDKIKFIIKKRGFKKALGSV